MDQRETGIVTWPLIKIDFINWFCLKNAVFSYKFCKKFVHMFI